MLTDFRFALRRLRQSPGYTIFAVVTLALAIGVTTAVYSLVRRGLQPNTGVSSADRLVALMSESGFTRPRPADVSWLDYQDLASQSQAFDRVVAWSPFVNSLTINGSSELAAGEMVTGNYFDAIQLRALRGRLIGAADDDAAVSGVAVISASTWRSRFQRDPSAIGATVKIAGQTFAIIGIAPDSFHGLGRPRGFSRPEVWIPLAAAPRIAQRWTRQNPNRRDHQWLEVAGRLANGKNKDEATTELTNLGLRLDRAEPMPPIQLTAGGTAPRPRAWTARVVGDPDDWSDAKDATRIILLLPLLVLLVACTNLANFSLSRGIARQNELAVRQAVGASRWQLMRGQVIEYGVIAAAGAIGGLLVADRLLALVASTVRDLWGNEPQYRIDASIDGAVMATVCGAALLSVLVAGLLQALQLTRKSLARSMADSQAAASLPRWRGRSNLIALQVSVSVALLLVAALCVRQLPKIGARVDSGMSLDRVALLKVPFDIASMQPVQVRRLLDDAVAAIRQQAGTEVATFTSGRQYLEHLAIGPAGQPLDVNSPRQALTRVLSVAPDYFRTVGITLTAGRPNTENDIEGSEPIAVVSSNVALQHFGTTNVIGRKIAVQRLATRFTPVELTIVGVASDTRTGRGEGSVESFVYVPFGQRGEDSLSIEIQARAAAGIDPVAVARQMRDTLRRIAPDVAVSYTGRADAIGVSQEVAMKMFATWFGMLAFLALGFAMSGLYGVLAHVVARRTRELGVRAALGADPARLVRMIFREGGRPVLEGVVIGFGIATGARLGMQPWFTEPVTAVDPVALVIAIVPLIGAAALACYLPARRAARVDPNVALREL